MTTINNIEDIKIWQKAKDITIDIYKECKHIDDFSFKDQIKRSSLSIASNIAEGFGRGGNKEFINFLYIALGSLSETKSDILIGYELDYFNIEFREEIIEDLNELRNKIMAFIKYLRESPIKGIKFKRGLDNE